ncbi:MAG: hypothetical protein ABIH23_25090 [bacterium]
MRAVLLRGKKRRSMVKNADSWVVGVLVDSLIDSENIGGVVSTEDRSITLFR